MKKKSKKKPAKKAVRRTKTAQKKGIGFSPMGDRVLVKPDSNEEGQVTSFGIIIPDSAKEKPEQGVVVAVGPGKKTDDGKVVPVALKVGDRVMFSKYGYDEVKVDGTEYYLVREDSVLAVLN